MAFLLIVFYGIFFIYGVLLMLSKDTAWRVVEWSNSIRGVASARTGRWEAYSTFQGILVALASAFFLCRLVSSPGLFRASQNVTHNAGSLPYVYTPPAAATPAHLNLSSPDAAFGLTEQPSQNGPALAWHLVPGGLIYYVNRSDTRRGPYLRLPDNVWDENGTAHYTDHTARSGQTYYYVVSAEDTAGKLLSNSGTVKAASPGAEPSDGPTTAATDAFARTSLQRG